MAALCALKRTAEFTDCETEAWFAVLSRFRATTINRAVIQISASLRRFPELSDILQECRKIEPPEIPYNPHGMGRDIDRLSIEEIAEIAGALGLSVEPVVVRERP